MDDKTQIIKQLTDLLADYMLKAIEAAQELEKATKMRNEWYQNWREEAAQHKETKAALAAIKEELLETQDALRNAEEEINRHMNQNNEEGATNNE